MSMAPTTDPEIQLLAGVAAEASLNQADGIHPNAEGAAIVAQRVHEALEPLLPILIGSRP